MERLNEHFANGGHGHDTTNKASASQSIRDLNVRLRTLQDKLCSPQNIDLSFVDTGDDSQQQEVDGLLLQIEFQRKRALENKLRELQRKKDKMDEILNNIQRQQTGRNQLSWTQLLPRTQRRYEAEGSAEDEGRYRQVPQRVIGNDAPGVEVRNSNLSRKYRELEEAELKLQQIEDLMKLIEEEAECEVKAQSNIGKNNRKTLNEDICNGYQQHRNVITEPKRVSRRAENTSQHVETSEVVTENVRSPDNFNFIATCASFPNIENGVNPEMVQQFKERFVQSMQSHYESMVSILENQLSSTSPMFLSQNFFYLLLMQNQQFLQQQQMLLCLLFQQSNVNSPTSPHTFQPQQCHECESRRNDAHSSFPVNQCLSSLRNQNKSCIPHHLHLHENSNHVTLNNQVAPGVKANNYWDNFKSNSRQNQLSLGFGADKMSGVGAVASKSNENILANNQMHSYSSHLSALTSAMKNITESSPASEPYQSMSTNPSSFRRSKKAANTSHHLESSSEKVQNATKESLSKSQTQDLSALYLMLEKFMADEKKDPKMAATLKSSNLAMRELEEVGAVGGDVSAMDGEQGDVRHSLQMHMSPSTGAIRKRRNPDLIDLVKDDNSENGSVVTEIRPLMAAEGRSSEMRMMNGLSQPPPIPASLMKRPPVTGATGRDDNDDSNDTSTDDDLAEADQTALELNGTESEVVPSVPIVLSSMPIESMVENEQNCELEEEEDAEDNETNRGGIRLSGDGEQGL